MAEGNGNGHGLPSWARVVAVLGFPVFIACVLLAAGLGLVNSPLAAIPALIREIDLLRTELRTHAMETRETTRVLRQICRNVAKSDAMAAQCEDRGHGP